jgi:acetolactate synthase-1/2/3 large subunit
MHPQPDQPLVPDALSIDQETTSPDEAARPEPTAEPVQAAPDEPAQASEPAVEPVAEVEPIESTAAPEGAEPAPAPVEPAPDAVAPAEPVQATPGDAAVEPAPAPVEPAPEALVPAAPPALRNVADLIAATMRAAGVRLAFTVPGESFLPVLDAFEAVGIHVVATRHEGAAAFAAEAYGQLTGRPAVCLGTRAVGASNLAIGVHTATADSTPMFVLIGDVTSKVKGREAFQEIDLVGTVGRLAKWAGEIEEAATAAGTLEAAVRAAVEGRPGPAVLAMSEDVLELPIPDGTVAPVVRPHPEAPDTSDVRAALNFLAGAERPLILAGAGVLRARCSNDLVRLAELLHVAVVASWRRGDVIPNDHPLYLGMTGYGSPSIVRERIEASDALLVLGARLNEPTTSGYRIPAPGQRWMHVDLEPRQDAAGDTPAPVRAIRADARAFVRAALARLKDAVLLAEPLQARDRNNPVDRAAWEAATIVDDSPWAGPGIHPGRIVADLRRLLPEDAIITTDAGAFAGWAARGFRFRRPGTFLGPTSGAMGYGLPAAIAAALVHRERRVIALLGDGGLGMTLAELETAVRVDAHLVAIVFDNESYGMIREHQELGGSPTSPGTSLGPVDFAAVARACGARGVRVDTDPAFEPALRTALAASGPTVIHLALDRRWVSVDDHPGTPPEA